MRSTSLFLAALLAIIASSSKAQTTPDQEQGIKPYGSY